MYCKVYGISSDFGTRVEMLRLRCLSLVKKFYVVSSLFHRSRLYAVGL